MIDDPAAIARALGGAQRAGAGWLARCPSHANTRTPALSIGTGRDGRLLLHCHAGCAGRDVLAALARLGLIAGRAGPARPADPEAAARRAAEAAAEHRRRLAAAERLWRAARPAAGTPVAAYLASRGLALRRMPPALRFHPKALHPSGAEGPAMLARIAGPAGEAMGLHRTWLAPDGSGKAALSPPRAMLGPSAGGAVRFGSGRVLVVAEGIETALSVGLAARLPVLACLSTSGLRAVLLPPLEVAGRVVLIAADADPPGIAAAEDAARRFRAEGRAVEIAAPAERGRDWNDVLQGIAP